MPACTRGCSVFTRPSRHSGNPVSSATSTTGTPAAAIVAAVEPAPDRHDQVIGQLVALLAQGAREQGHLDLGVEILSPRSVTQTDHGSFDAVGVPFEKRGKIMDENLDILKRFWTEHTVSGKFTHHDIPAGVMFPKPVQKPHPPILIGGYVDRVLKRAATVGDGWLTYFYTPESFTKSWQKVQAFAKEAGRDPSKLTATNQLAIYVGRNRAETEKDMRHWLSTEWDTAAWSESTIEHAIHGSAEECVEQLRVHVKTGVDRIILIPYRYEPAQVERVAKEVLPKL